MFPRIGSGETVSGVVHRKIIVCMGYILFLETPVIFDSPVSIFCVYFTLIIKKIHNVHMACYIRTVIS